MSHETSPKALPPVAAREPEQADFPTWLPPMLVKELRQGLRTRGFVGGLIAVQAALALVFVYSFATEAISDAGKSASDIFFWLITGGVLLAAPALRALGALGPEIDQRTIDLLLLTRLDARRIVWGKWASLQAQTLLLLTTLLPYAVVRYFFGSVDLVNDFGVMAGMLAGGAVLSATGLWVSGLPKVLRVVVMIGMVIAMPNFLGVIFARSSHVIISVMPVADIALWWALGLWSAAVGLIYMLVLAVRLFAPPAENHAQLPRLVPLALALPAPALAAAGRLDLAGAQIVATVAALVLVAAIELVTEREPMAIHLRGWQARGKWRTLAERLALPGWPSAALWLAATLALFGAGWATADAWLAQDLKTGPVLVCLALAWAGLVFPMALVSQIPSARKTAGGLYLLVHALLGVFAAFAGNETLGSLAPPFMRTLNWISHAVPTASFWHAVMELEKPSGLPGVMLGQAGGLILTAGLTYWLARPYWERVRWLRGESKRDE